MQPLKLHSDFQKVHSLEVQQVAMLADTMVWHLGAVLAKYLHLYSTSEMNLYLDFLLACCLEVKTDF